LEGFVPAGLHICLLEGPTPVPNNGDRVPGADHLLRYVDKKYVDQGTNQIDGSGFLARKDKGEASPSANWMECFAPPTENQMNEIRAVRRIRYERKGRLARINVQETIQHLTANAKIPLALAFVHDQLQATETHPPDPSHVLMHGIPGLNTSEAEFVRDLLRECVLELFIPTPG
jgi:hypothetical protein